MSEIPEVIAVAEIAAISAGLAAVCVALYAGARAVGTPTPRSFGLAASAGGVLAGWLLVATALAAANAFVQRHDDPVPWIGVTILGTFVAWLALTEVPVVAGALADPGAPGRLVAVQTFRVVGAAFVVLMVLGRLPAAFALPAGLGDVAVGVAAPFVAARLADPDDAGRVRSAVWFNYLGLLDLVVAIGIGFLAAPGPMRVLTLAPSTSLMSRLPLALIPTVAVPVAAALHVLSLRRLHASTTSRPARPRLTAALA